MKAAVLPFLFLLVFSFPMTGCASLGRAQTAEINSVTGIPRKQPAAVKSDFPLWIRDLRRAEIVAFGSFPFTMFTATFVMDTYRWAANGGGVSEDARKYAPWPFKSAGAIEMSEDEHLMVMAAAASASAAIALLDHLIVQAKRHKARQRALRLPPGTPIITRNPAGPGAGGGAAPDGGSPAAETPAAEEEPVPAPNVPPEDPQ
ncbi:MAG: hypothetical protein LBQ55_11075 [Treponema sp.]|nr:hypothetical protein [Treponema sp.]